eukprot:1357642-Alexandrium_andersonii.AAC.1
MFPWTYRLRELDWQFVCARAPGAREGVRGVPSTEWRAPLRVLCVCAGGPACHLEGGVSQRSSGRVDDLGTINSSPAPARGARGRSSASGRALRPSKWRE